VTVKVQVPAPRNDEQNIVYAYALAHAEQDPLFEVNLISNGRVRYIEFDHQAAKQMNALARNHYAGATILANNNDAPSVDQIDGLVLFGNDMNDPAGAARISNLKRMIMTDLAQVGAYLNNPNISESSNLIRRVFKQLNNINKTLCAKDDEYKMLFEAVTTFLNSLNTLKYF
jgi:hypothetical protein